MNFSRRMIMTSRPTVTCSLWNEACFLFLLEILPAVSDHAIPNELIINVDQTPSKFVPTDNVTIEE